MPGAYAHITLANELSDVNYLEGLPSFPTQAIQAILRYFKFCELGSVSPDYPYLDFLSSVSTEWADTMHRVGTGEFLKAGVAQVGGMKGAAQQKCVAWLLGFASHVAADVCVHPVVERKVGPYEQNKKEHRVCEMNEDVYIFARLNLGDIGLSEHLDSGVGACTDPQNGRKA